MKKSHELIVYAHVYCTRRVDAEVNIMTFQAVYMHSEDLQKLAGAFFFGFPPSKPLSIGESSRAPQK